MDRVLDRNCPPSPARPAFWKQTSILPLLQLSASGGCAPYNRQCEAVINYLLYLETLVNRKISEIYYFFCIPRKPYIPAKPKSHTRCHIRDRNYRLRTIRAGGCKKVVQKALVSANFCSKRTNFCKLLPIFAHFFHFSWENLRVWFEN